LTTLTTKVFSYIRFSSDKQERGDSVRRQTELAERWVAENPQLGDLELDTSTYRDFGVSAFKGLNVAETGKLGMFKRAVEDGDIPKGSILVVESLDRISRQSARKALSILGDIVDMDITVVTLSDKKTYTKQSLDDDSMSLMLALMVFIRANEESKMKADRGNANWKRKRQLAVESGRVMSKNVATWIDVCGEKPHQTFVLNEKAATVRLIVEMFMGGRGCQAIATHLNSSNVPTLRNGQRWEPRSVHSILSNPALCGRYVMGEKAIQPKEAAIDGYYPALISVEQFNEINLMLNTGNVKQRDEIANPVAGICYCSLCGSKMTRFKTKSHGERLICSAAKVRKCEGGFKTIKLAKVYDRLKLIVKHPKTFGNNNQMKILTLRVVQTDLETKISNVGEAIMLQGHSPALGARLKALEAEKSILDAQIENEASRAVLGGSEAMNNRLIEVREAIEANDIPMVNGLFRRLFDRVVVNVHEQTINTQWIG
jgi:DNA invertase Pin-like site-specific DNA recombinase